MPQRRLIAGSSVDFTTGARTAMGDPITTAQLTANLISPDGDTTAIQLANKGEEHAGSIQRVIVPGDYQIKVDAVDAEGQPLGSCVTNFEVMDQDVELSNPAADPDQMARLANLTRESGGRTLAPEQVTELLEDIKQNPPKMVEEVLTRWQLTDTWWDAWLVLGCLSVLLGAEWFLRKRWGLV
jgi:hypothetical protein